MQIKKTAETQLTDELQDLSLGVFGWVRIGLLRHQFVFLFFERLTYLSFTYVFLHHLSLLLSASRLVTYVLSCFYNTKHDRMIQKWDIGQLKYICNLFIYSVCVNVTPMLLLALFFTDHKYSLITNNIPFVVFREWACCMIYTLNCLSGCLLECSRECKNWKRTQTNAKTLQAFRLKE